MCSFIGNTMFIYFTLLVVSIESINCLTHLGNGSVRGGKMTVEDKIALFCTKYPALCDSAKQNLMMNSDTAQHRDISSAKTYHRDFNEGEYDPSNAIETREYHKGADGFETFYEKSKETETNDSNGVNINTYHKRNTNQIFKNAIHRIFNDHTLFPVGNDNRRRNAREKLKILYSLIYVMDIKDFTHSREIVDKLLEDIESR